MSSEASLPLPHDREEPPDHDHDDDHAAAAPRTTTDAAAAAAAQRHHDDRAPASTTFSVRIVSVDTVMAKPIPNVDICYSPFVGSAIQAVPVIRIFGATPAGQKTCLHLHKAFPYFFVAFDDETAIDGGIEAVEAYSRRLALSIERALDVALGKVRSFGASQHVFKIQLVRGMPFYGFYPCERLFLKVFLYNPQLQTRIVNLLRSGAIMAKFFQVFEAHIPFTLQVFIDYNLYGMGMVHLDNVRFRAPMPVARKHAHVSYDLLHDTANERDDDGARHSRLWLQSNSTAFIHPASLAIERQSTCELEADASIEDVLNLYQTPSPPQPADNPTMIVQSLASLWHDDRARRVLDGLPATQPPPPSIPRELPDTPSSMDTMLRERLKLAARLDLAALERDKLQQQQRSSADNPSSSAAAVYNNNAVPLEAFVSRELGASPEWVHSVLSQAGASPSLAFPHTPLANSPFLMMSEKQWLTRSSSLGLSAASLARTASLIGGAAAPPGTLGPPASVLHHPTVVSLSSVSLTEADVDEQLVLSQNSDDEMGDILNWMRDEEFDDGDDEEIEEERRRSQQELQDIIESSRADQQEDDLDDDDLDDEAGERRDNDLQGDAALPIRLQRIPQFDGSGDEIVSTGIISEEKARKRLRAKQRRIRRGLRYCSLFHDSPASGGDSDSSANNSRSTRSTSTSRSSRKRSRTARDDVRPPIVLSVCGDSSGDTSDDGNDEADEASDSDAPPLAEMEAPKRRRTAETESEQQASSVTSTTTTATTTATTTTTTTEAALPPRMPPPTAARAGSFCIPESPPIPPPALQRLGSILVAETQLPVPVTVTPSPPMCAGEASASSSSGSVLATPEAAVRMEMEVREGAYVWRSRVGVQGHAPASTEAPAMPRGRPHERRAAAPRRYRFNRTPPIDHQLCQSLRNYGLPEVVYREPFYGNEADQPREPKVFGGREFRIPTAAVKHLPDFAARGLLLEAAASTTLQQLQRRHSAGAVVPMRSSTLQRFTLPKLPPSRAATEKWLRDTGVSEAAAPAGRTVVADAPHFSACTVPRSMRYGGGGDTSPRRLARMLASQIEGATPDSAATTSQGLFAQGIAGGTGGGGGSGSNGGSLRGLNQHLTVMSIEIHVNTRGDLRPNPILDPVSMVVFAVQEEDKMVLEGEAYQMLRGAIIVRDKPAASAAPVESAEHDDDDDDHGSLRLSSDSGSLGTKAATGAATRLPIDREAAQWTAALALQQRIMVDDEAQLFDALVKVVHQYDPDILTGFEVQCTSLGYLIERANTSTHQHRDLCTELGRIKPTASGSGTRQPASFIPNIGPTRTGGGAARRHDQHRGDDNENDHNDDAGAGAGAAAAASSSSAPKRSARGVDAYSYNHGAGLSIVGRIVLNLWRILRSEVTTNIYTFENLAFHILQQRMAHYSFATLSKFYKQTSSNVTASSRTGVTDGSSVQARVQHPQRWLVGRYYITRALANIMMLERLNIIGRTSELARVYGIDFYSVLTRGSQYRVESMMLRLTKPNNYILLSPSRAQVNGMRAAECLPLIMEPISRLYTSPVIVLDFQSLYPSIIIAYNYCYSTCLGRMEEHTIDDEHQAAAATTAAAAATTTKQPRAATTTTGGNNKKFGAASISLPKGLIAFLEQEEQLVVSPNQVMFVKPSVRRGVLPAMLQQILDTRIMVKNAMKRAQQQGNQPLVRLLDARQYGLKMIANVTYGYTSASFSGRMPCIDIADSIVQTGRETLERAIRMVESNAEWGARVVYGDTDSLFVLVEGASRERAFEVGHQIATAVTRANPAPVTLKFEKVYHPCTLLSKKRYAGAMFETPEQRTATFDAKGIETVRRDTCGAVAKIMRKAMSMLFDSCGTPEHQQQQQHDAGPDLSRIKAYLQRQFDKINAGRVSVQDFVFAKEVRLGTYSERGVPPPAALVASKQMELDPRAEPRYGERVPYVVVHGAPSARLFDLVMSPLEFVRRSSDLTLHATYYITKQIIPALERVFQLLGADVRHWYAEMPRRSRRTRRIANLKAATERFAHLTATTSESAAVHRSLAPPKKRKAIATTIDQYYLSCHCPVCDQITNTGLCQACGADKQRSAMKLLSDLQRLERQLASMNELCMNCTGIRNVALVNYCQSLDCTVFFERHKLADAMQQLDGFRQILDSF